MNKFMRYTSMMALFFILQGCSTMADSVAAKGSGTYRIYQYPYDHIWDTTLEAISLTQLSLVTQDKTTGQILAQQGISAFSYGENVAVFIESLDAQSRTRVEVVSKKSMSTNIFATNWETKILNKLDQALEQQNEETR